LFSLPAGPSVPPGASSVAAVVGPSQSLPSLTVHGTSPTAYPAASAVHHTRFSRPSLSDIFIPGHFLLVAKGIWASIYPSAPLATHATPGANVSEKALGELNHASPTHSSLLDEALHVVHLAAASTGGVVAPSYDVLLTSEHMHFLPRQRTKRSRNRIRFIRRRLPARQMRRIHTYRLGVNAPRFAGTLLAKTDAEMRAIEVKGFDRPFDAGWGPKVELNEQAEGALA
ncbi:hypothetical protein FRC06_005629, partial [Ceratobasidium sp. 370]